MGVSEPPSTGIRERSDARRNKQVLLTAAAAAFAESGVDVPVRNIATRAGVGMGTVYRHFPTRADLVIAVYQHQVDACAAAGPALLKQTTAFDALTQWVAMFVDFLVTKHGLAAALQSDNARFETLHAYFLERLLPIAEQLLTAVTDSGETTSPIEAYALLRGIGNLCASGGDDARYDARKLVGLLIAGMRAG